MNHCVEKEMKEQVSGNIEDNGGGSVQEITMEKSGLWQMKPSKSQSEQDVNIARCEIDVISYSVSEL